MVNRGLFLIGGSGGRDGVALSFRLSQLQYRIYVRHAGDVEKIQRELEVCLGEGLDAHYVQADVCRQELLVEIEATGSLPRP